MQSRPRITVFTSTVFAILFFANYAQAQFEALNEGQAALEKGHRLKSVRLISEAAEKHPELKDVLYQYLPVISDYSIEIPFAAARQLSPANASYLETLGESAHQLERVKAMEAIVKAVRGRQIVILNEAHDTPAHRAFGMQLAKALANEGFQYLAIETLALPKSRAGLVDLNFPRLATGSYSKEPVFGDFIRQAVQFGYKLVAYEIDAEQRKKIDRADSYSGVLVREEAQADNIIDAVLKVDPDARILIFVGYSHATEDWSMLEDGRELGWLAARLRRKTDIDPLTIDQVGGSYNIKTGEVDAVYQLLHNEKPMESPTVFRRKDGSCVTSDRYYGKVDMSLFHPLQEMVKGRPDWLQCDGYRKPFDVRNKEYYRGTRTLLQAFLQDEPDDAIPMDQVVIESGKGDSTLLLPVGRYRLVSQIDDGTSVTIGAIEVRQ